MTAPSMSYLDGNARHYRDALAHAATVGLPVQQAKVEIGAVLLRDTAAGRVTDWHGVCDRISAEADCERVAAQLEQRRAELPSVTVIVPARDVSCG